MSADQPMGSSGVDIDMTTGRPRVPKVDEERAKVVSRLEKTIMDSWQITAELHQNSQMLKVWLQSYRNRLLELAEADSVCQALAAPIMAVRNTLEFKPIIAEKVARRKLGPRLSAFIE
jgi:hypothetical protein